MTASAADSATGSTPGAGLAAMPSAPSATEDLADLYRSHAVSLVRVALLLVGDQATAEDVVQDVFARLQRGGTRRRRS